MRGRVHACVLVCRARERTPNANETKTASPASTLSPATTQGNQKHGTWHVFCIVAAALLLQKPCSLDRKHALHASQGPSARCRGCKGCKGCKRKPGCWYAGSWVSQGLFWGPNVQAGMGMLRRILGNTSAVTLCSSITLPPTPRCQLPLARTPVRCHVSGGEGSCLASSYRTDRRPPTIS